MSSSAISSPSRAIKRGPADSQVSFKPRALRLRIDPLLLLATLGLLGCSIYAMKLATSNDVPGEPYYFVYRQALYAGIGLVLMYAMSRLDYSRLRELKYPIYGVLLSTILFVLVVGSATRGTRGWIDLPFFRVQPSEFGKVLLIVAVAAFIVDRLRKLGQRDTTARVLLLALVPVMLVADFGASTVYIVITLALLFVAGAPVRHFAALGALVAVIVGGGLFLAPMAGVEVLKPYQTDRLTSFLHPGDARGAEGYQQHQSLIAIGSGEKTGRGPDQASQTNLDFLPEHHTDFIFSVIGETYGFAGAALVLSLYALMIWRGLRILTIAKNLYGALIAGGVVTMLLFQVFVNIGMSVGIMPITGVTAPLLSYGGSSMLSTLLALGLLQSVNAQARETGFKGRSPGLLQG